MNDIAFISDYHLRFNEGISSQHRAFLEKLDIFDKVFFLGDIFDFYFPFNNYIPPVFTEFLQLISESSEQTELYYIRGNHDLWKSDIWGKYGIMELESPFHTELNGIKATLLHGDKIFMAHMKQRHMYKMLNNSFNIRMFSLIPNAIAYKSGTFVTGRFSFDQSKDDMIKQAQLTIHNNDEFNCYYGAYSYSFYWS